MSKTPKRSAAAPPSEVRSRTKGANALLLAAERLFAEHGLEAVSMRQIVDAAGQANNYAVQHHFGDRDGLIRAILELRLPELDRIRAARLRKLKLQGNVDVRALLGALFMPIADLKDETGRHVYAHFLLRVGWGGATAMWGREHGIVPAAHNILDELHALCPDMSLRTFGERLELIGSLFFHAVALLDQKAAAGLSAAGQKKYLEQVLDMCAGALCAPTRR